jgi:hypothetical protein
MMEQASTIHLELAISPILQRIHKRASENSNERANRYLEFGAAVLQSCSAAVLQ